jgi:hypothetical protein
MKRGELSDDALVLQAEQYFSYEVKCCGAGLRDELFVKWADSKDFHPFDREAIRLILLGRGIKVRRAA